MPNEPAQEGLDILSPENLLKVKNALEHGIILVHHYHHFGSRNAWAFRDFDRYKELVAGGKSKDVVFVWSVAELIDERLHLAIGRFSEMKKRSLLLLPTDQFEAVKGYLDGYQEIHGVIVLNEINIVFFNATASPMFKVLTLDRNDLDFLSELLEKFNQLGGEVYIFGEKELYQEENILLRAIKR